MDRSVCILARKPPKETERVFYHLPVMKVYAYTNLRLLAIDEITFHFGYFCSSALVKVPRMCETWPRIPERVLALCGTKRTGSDKTSCAAFDKLSKNKLKQETHHKIYTHLSSKAHSQTYKHTHNNQSCIYS